MTATVTVDEQRISRPAPGERILVRAPTGDDAALIGQILGSRGFVVVPIEDTAGLAAAWRDGAGTLLIASEALNEPDPKEIDDLRITTWPRVIGRGPSRRTGGMAECPKRTRQSMCNRHFGQAFVLKDLR